ncbi:insulinase family protein [Candidatus Similichlamydia laticola]|uniref:Protease 3 n=1 Tax=Candidatus Similichlamydia laticola TaxID=2170265 RepID=A0A369KCG8_9BACT|nr:insulinase family protein [Candidatus Similichlamydia laticola]RDB31292.1 hypothetical protein HAT2_00609 [Candidatus Similichlamydia laticola]
MKLFLFLGVLLSLPLIFGLRFLLKKWNEEEAVLVEDKNPYQDLSPRLQDLEVEKWKLKNGLALLLVHDPDVSQCGIGLLSHVGSADDPPDARGAAHFVEHMLAGRTNAEFSDGVNEFVLGQGGTYNAFTSMGFTFYGISLSHELLEPTAKRLFAMLQKPLFLEEETKAELSAVDEEFYIHSMNDGFRVWSGILSQLNGDCPMQRYHPGNKITLGHKTGGQLKEWFESHYTSHKATCVAISSKPLEELRRIVLPLAQQVPIRKKWERDLPVYEQKESRFIFTETLQGTNCLLLVWTFPPAPLPEKQQDLYLLVHLINSEHSGGLSSTLKEMGLAEVCEGSIELLGNQLPALFCLEVKLTDQGVAEWKKVYALIETFLEAAKQLDSSHAEKMVEELHLAQLLGYQYRCKTQAFDFVSRLVISLAREPLETFPFHSVAPHAFRYTAYQKAIERLIENKKIVLLGSAYSKWAEAEDGMNDKPKNHNELSKMPLWEYPYYATSLPSVTKAKVTFCPPKLQRFLPQAIPQPYPIQKASTLAIAPQCLSGSSSGPLFLLQDIYFGIPKDYFLICLKHPRFFHKDPKWHLCAEMWGRMLNKSLDELEYSARTAGNRMSLGPKTPYSLHLSLVAWEQVSEKLLKEFLEQIREAKLVQKHFDRALEEMVLDIQAIEASPPYQTARRLFEENIQDAIPTLEERKLFVQSATLSDIEQFTETFLKETSFESIYLGQKNSKQLSNLLDPLERFFPTSYSEEMGSVPFHSGLELGTKIVRFPSPLPGHAARLSIDCGSALLPHNCVCSWILSSGLDPIAMNQLREQEELAYVVRCGSQETNGRLFLTVLTQSTKVDCDFLLQRYRQLLDDLLQKMGTNPFFHTQKFEALRTSFLELLKAPSTSATDLLAKAHRLAFEKEREWSFDAKMVRAAEELTFQKFKLFCERVLQEKQIRQLLIAVEGSLQKSEGSSS